MKLNDEELLNIDGGAVKLFTAIAFGLGALAALITGIVDGYLNPLKCN